MEYLKWYGEHPWLGTLMLFLTGSVIVQAFQAIFRKKK